MRRVLLWAMLVYVVLELWCFSVVIAHMGLFLVLVEVFASAIGGIWVLKHIARFDARMLFRQNVFSILQRSALSALGGVLLIMPGLLGDMLGVICVLWAWLISNNYTQSADTHTRTYHYTTSTKTDTNIDDEIIDVEVLEPESTQSKKAR